MTEFGGLGGVPAGRALNEADAFEMAVNRALGDRIRESDETASAMWSALANMDWQHTNGDTAGYSFRAAGDLVAAVRGSGDYMDWYCSGPLAYVSDEILTALAAEGWSPVIEEAIWGPTIETGDIVTVYGRPRLWRRLFAWLRRKPIAYEPKTFRIEAVADAESVSVTPTIENQEGLDHGT